MTRARIAALIAILLALAAGALALSRGGRPAERTKLLYLSSLPILYGEQFGLDGPAHPVLAALRERFELVPIDVTDPGSLKKCRLLIMAQPRAQPPENLVALDEWVRRGGRVLIFADPMLEWPSDTPLADPTRPPRMFADTGLLGHWGLRLDAPDERGPVTADIAGRSIVTASPGTLHGDCRIEEGGLIAECVVSRGRAIVVADADLLNVESGNPGASGNLAALETLLSRLER